ncbi:MAG TPA: PucR family transcriptional regulator, partial [Nocardioides sp.]|nr:PucR family transcriptional regulator [Nocardioides sp.]
MTTSTNARHLELDLVELLRGTLPEVAQHTIAAVREEVPAYGEGLGDQLAATIEQAVQMALAGFLRVAARTDDPGTPLTPTLEGAYALGRGEARAGRSADALLSAYRVGARVAWRELSATAVAAGVPAQAVASFAELVFAYIDELSAASVAGHTDELETTGRVRQHYLDRLAAGLLRGEPAEALGEAAERADWTPPRTLTAVLLPEAQVRPVLGLVPHGALTSNEHGVPDEGLAVVLVPDMAGRSRPRLLRMLADRHAVVGPARPWREVRTSYDRAVRALSLPRTAAPLDTDRNLTHLVVGADPEALTDLRAAVLAPLSEVRPSTAEKLQAT